jgi:hypothetical protein
MKRLGAALLLVGITATLAGCDSARNFLDLFKKEKAAEEELTWSQGAPPQQRQLAIILDNSGSMKQQDEQGMMLFSSLVFLDMLDSDDLVYATSFPNRDVVASDNWQTGKVNEACKKWITFDGDKIGPLSNNPEGNAELKEWVKNLTYTSQITVFKEPLQRAINNLVATEPDKSKRYIIFFTDGNTDRGGDHSPGGRSRAHDLEREELLSYRDDLVKNNIVFYGVVLGNNTRDDHLIPLAQATGGAVVRAAKADDLVDKFANVFGNILETKVENISLTPKYSHRINKYVKEFILLIPDKGDEIKISFDEPGGRNLSGAIGGTDGSRRQDGIRNLGPYQIIHVNNPKAGDWEFKMSGVEAAKVLLIQNYDVFLQIYGSYPRRGLMNMPNLIRGRLVDSRGEPIQDPAFFSEQEFRYKVDYEQQFGEMPPNEQYGFEFEITPQDTLYHDLVCTAGNGSWLTRALTVSFGGKDGVLLRVNNDAEFGEVVPYADGMYFWWCRWVSRLLGLPHSRDWHHNKAKVRFKGTDEALKGVVFNLEVDGLYDEHRMRLVDKRHRARFVIDDNFEASFRLDLDRSASTLEGRCEVPIIYPSDAGKIRGDKVIGVQADVQELNWAWRTSNFWLQWLIYLWLFLFFIYRPLHYTVEYSTRSITYKPRAEARGDSQPHPSENTFFAFLRALLLFYPLRQVKTLVKKSGKGGSSLHAEGGGKNALRRAFLFVVGIPVGPYARPFNAKVGTHKKEFYRSGRNILMKEADLNRILDKDPPGDKRNLVKISNTIVYPIPNTDAEGRFTINNK